MKHFLLVISVLSIGTISLSKLLVEYEWKYFDLLWNSPKQRQEAIDSGIYDPNVAFLFDVDKAPVNERLDYSDFLGFTGGAVKNCGQNLCCNPTVSAEDVEHACVCTIVYTIPYIKRKNESLTISVHYLTSIENIVQCLIVIIFPTSRFYEIIVKLQETSKNSQTTNSNMYLERICQLSMILAVAFAAPRPFVSTPTWHQPCGQLDLQPVPSKNLKEEMRSSLESLKLQHQLTIKDYLNRDYEYLYERVRIGVDDHQYIPNWVPGTKDVNLIRKLADTNTPMIVDHYPKLHMDLQKFAVAFEQLIEDEPKSETRQALKATQSYLTMMLCEVESNIISFPTIQFPIRVERSIMSHTERNPIDETRRLIRDWGVILKYRDYLHAWRHVFDY